MTHCQKYKHSQFCKTKFFFLLLPHVVMKLGSNEHIYHSHLTTSVHQDNLDFITCDAESLVD